MSNGMQGPPTRGDLLENYSQEEQRWLMVLGEAFDTKGCTPGIVLAALQTILGPLRAELAETKAALKDLEEQYEDLNANFGDANQVLPGDGRLSVRIAGLQAALAKAEERAEKAEQDALWRRRENLLDKKERDDAVSYRTQVERELKLTKDELSAERARAERAELDYVPIAVENHELRARCSRIREETLEEAAKVAENRDGCSPGCDRPWDISDDIRALKSDRGKRRRAHLRTNYQNRRC